METENSFPDELCGYLSANGFSCLPYDEVGFASAIKVLEGGNLRLVLVTVRLADRTNSMEELITYFSETDSRRAAGIKSVMVWEDYWITKKRIVKSRLLAMLGHSQKIPGRLTQARRITKETAANFLEINHLNGATSSKIRYGLYLPKRYFRILKGDLKFDINSEELLVAVATFSYPRVFKNDGKEHRSYELIRFASLTDTNVVGGLDKLLHAFSAEKNPDDIMTYADLDWSDGAGYQKLGFEMRGKKEPEVYRLEPDTLKRVSAPQNDPASFHSGLDDIRVYNMGSLKFVKNIG